MCRFLAYHGEPILIETLVASPTHSLIKQSQHAAEGKTETNGDGFGVGWYGERAEPGLYRELRPAWSDKSVVDLRAGAVQAVLRACAGGDRDGDHAGELPSVHVGAVHVHA